MQKPTKIQYKKASKTLVLSYQDQEFQLTAEFLRVHSPSAEVRGHGPQEAILQIEKKDVAITAIEPVGNYALKISYDDGHDSGLYTWDYLKDLAENQTSYWEKYLSDLEAAGAQREPKVFFKSQ
ncbi:gamma-butyrobetaine hydroxylase-like domain-containing protein [Litoribrevibacter euphylliae]|uniref:Gamma-butyrobetaine hydroxylase-like domain-containing protein n=1 Tax=Litoribrevibacter euphylliae TaxID=1834034 RepID=A0ABV7HLZ9_9GAMM